MPLPAKHYCADCDTHFRVDVEMHAAAYHDSGLFRGVQDGDWRDFECPDIPECP